MISVIVAVANDRVIGGNNDLLWHISEDLKNFKAITSGHPVIMGRKTFESLGRALPNRANVVITRQKDLVIEGVTLVNSLQEALSIFGSDEEVFIIGGAQIYEQAMPLADKFYLTKVHKSFEGDTFFPEWNTEDWKLEKREYFERGAKFDSPFEFLEYSSSRNEK